MRQPVKPQFKLGLEDLWVSSRRVFTRDFKVAAVKEIESGKTLGYVARRLEVNPNTLYRWRRELINCTKRLERGQA